MNENLLNETVVEPIKDDTLDPPAPTLDPIDTVSSAEPVEKPEIPEAVKRKKPQVLPPIEQLYRQVFDLIDSKLYGFEAQTRINDPKLGTLTPDLFVPIAERSNQIVELGKWSFVEMSDMIRRQKDKDHHINCMFMPVSIKYFTKRYFSDNVMRQVDKADMKPEQVCVILQSQDLLGDPVTLQEAFQKVHEKGIKIAVANVGSDGISLARFSELPIDYLRLDADFVNQLLNDERAKDIANTFSELAVKLGAQMMADGVDTKEHAAALQSIGCALMQGKYFAEYEREEQMF